MSEYKPKPGSKTEAAIEFIKKNNGTARTRAIAKAVDIQPPSNVAIFLKSAVESGLLLTCKVKEAGHPEEIEYKLSAGGKPMAFTELKVPRLRDMRSSKPGIVGYTEPMIDIPAPVVTVKPNEEAMPQKLEQPTTEKAAQTVTRFAIWDDKSLLIIKDGKEITLSKDEAQRLHSFIGL